MHLNLMPIGCFASVWQAYSYFTGLGRLPALAGFAQMMGIPYIVAALVTFAELAGRIDLIVCGFKSDLITWISGLAIAPVMLGAIVMVHWGRWGFAPGKGFPIGGMKFQVVLLLAGLYFIIVGNSKLSD